MSSALVGVGITLAVALTAAPVRVPLPSQSPVCRPPQGQAGGAGAPAPGVTTLADLPSLRFGTDSPPDLNGLWYGGGSEFLYISPGETDGQCGPAMSAVLRDGAGARPLTDGPAYSAVRGPEGSWGPGPDGRLALVATVAYVAWRGDRTTIYMRRLDSGETVDLLHGEPPGLSGGFLRLHGWIDSRTLAFEEAAGLSVRRLHLIDTYNRRLLPTPLLEGFSFHWQTNRLAGQSYGRHPSFWIWDRRAGRLLTPERLPGETQFFEAWTTHSDAGSALFTTWMEGDHPYTNLRGWPTLYRLDIDSGRIRKIADRAGLAGWNWVGRDLFAYIRFGESYNLVLTDGERTLYTEDLGRPRPGDDPRRYRPLLEGHYLFYRTTRGELKVLHLHERRPRLLFQGEFAAFSAATGGELVAVLSGGRLFVLRNPLWR